MIVALDPAFGEVRVIVAHPGFEELLPEIECAYRAIGPQFLHRRR